MINSTKDDNSNKKTQRILLELNKCGLYYLTNHQFSEAFDYLKKAQRKVIQELRIDLDNVKINQLAGITYNNLACYYKKTNKPNVALTYLKKALELQVYKVADWTSTASTHLNICAIYSFLKKHQQSADHAQLALEMLSKLDQKAINDNNDSDKSFAHVKMLSHYNLAIQLEHLKKSEVAKQNYILALQIAEKSAKKNEFLIKNLHESIQRIEHEQYNAKKKSFDDLVKRKNQSEKGYHKYIFKNKKNYRGNEWRQINNTRRYDIYKTEGQEIKESSEKKFDNKIDQLSLSAQKFKKITTPISSTSLIKEITRQPSK